MSSSYHRSSLVLPTGTSQQSTSTTSELFRSDLITAMKLPDSHYLEPSNYVEIKEQWRSEWEIGVQVCVSPESIPKVSYRTLSATDKGSQKSRESFVMPASLFTDEVNHSLSQEEILSRGRYEIDELDLSWIELVNEKRKYKIMAGPDGLTESMLEKSILALEKRCYQNMMKALSTEESLKIEYDHSIVCDVCKDPDREDKNEMVFCDLCNVCVHQACYGIQIIPRGSWICRPCSSSSSSSSSLDCLLCPNKGGAMKRVKPSPGWAHMTCALWIPEVKIANVEKMEPITNIEYIPNSRWSLLCCVCRDKRGACIQCSYPTCVSSYHVTCGFKSGLEMKSHLNTTGVRHESYCPRHTTLRRTPSKQLLSPTSRGSRRREEGGEGESDLAPLERLEQRFYDYASSKELSHDMKVSLQLSSLIYNYWKLKRKCNHNQPLLLGLHLDLSYQRLQAGCRDNVQVVPLTEDEDFLTIINLRHNLEKARNLLYMTQKRERLKSLSLRLTHQATQLELQLASTGDTTGTSTSTVGHDEHSLTRRPLCLKRLGVSNEVTTPTNNKLDNGLHPLINTHLTNDRLETQNIRMLRKRLGSQLELDEATHPRPHQRLAESNAHEGVGVVNVFKQERNKSSRSTVKTILC